MTIVLMFLSVSGLVIYERGQQTGTRVVEKVIKLQEADPTGRIIVQIDGAIVKPGVYQVSGNTHVYELILIAGGLKPEASVGKINLAKILENGDRISINQLKLPKTKTSKRIQKKTTTSKIPEYLININYANFADLQKIPGIKSTTAQDIIDYRLKYKKFEDINDLMNIKGIGEKKLEKIKKYISI